MLDSANKVKRTGLLVAFKPFCIYSSNESAPSIRFSHWPFQSINFCLSYCETTWDACWVCQKIFGVRCEKQKHIIWIYYEYASSKMFEKLLNSFFLASLFFIKETFSAPNYLFSINSRISVNIYTIFILFSGFSGHVSIHPGPWSNRVKEKVLPGYWNHSDTYMNACFICTPIANIAWSQVQRRKE